MTLRGRGSGGLNLSLVGAIVLGLAMPALGSILLAKSNYHAPKRRFERAVITAATVPTVKKIPLALPAEPRPASGDIKPDDVQSSDIQTGDASAPDDAPTPDPRMDEVNQYLWAVYERSTVKRDGTGDFTWKDIAAANRLGMTLGDYVIVGMDADFREILYRAGRAMDAAGFRWTILSAFRDDYRQELAAGYKARVGNSLHGGSRATGGYGHGCAIDITDADGRAVPLWQWLDADSAQINIERPLPGIDPAHVQPHGPWHELAEVLRRERLSQPATHGSEDEDETGSVLLPAAAAPTGPPSEADMTCIGLHHHWHEPQVADGSSSRRHHSIAQARADHQRGKAIREAKAGARQRLQHQVEGDVTRESDAVVRTADAGKDAAHGKASAHGLAHHALRALPRAAGSA
jgi:hypothetical protein